MAVRAILFDAVGTLIHADPPVTAIYAEVGRRFGSTLDVGMIGQRFHEALAAEDKVDRTVHGLRTDQTRERERWRRIVAGVFCDVADSAAIFDALWRHFASPSNWRLYDDVRPCLQRLSGQELTVGVASNFDGRLHGIVGSFSPLEICRRVFVSSEVGWRKPAVDFFRAVERTLGLPPHEILLVGDDWENDYIAAANAGWQAVLLDREGRESTGTHASIRSLAELSEIAHRWIDGKS